MSSSSGSVGRRESLFWKRSAVSERFSNGSLWWAVSCVRYCEGRDLLFDCGEEGGVKCVGFAQLGDVLTLEDVDVFVVM